MDRKTKAAIIASLCIILLQIRVMAVFYCYYLHRKEEQVLGKRKRARCNSIDTSAMIVMMTSFMDDTQETVDKMIKAIVSLTESNRPTPTPAQLVWDALCELPDIATADRITAAYKLVHHPQTLELFFHSNGEGKSTVVQLILRGLICNDE